MNKPGITMVGGGLVGLAMLFVSVAQTSGAKAQSGRRSGQQARQTTGRSDGAFEQRFWHYLSQAQYRNWAPAPGGTGDFQQSQAPHGAFVKLYLNRTAAAHPDELPSGSIIVKENFGPDREKLMAVTVMYRNDGYNPEGGDWYWVKYRPDGTVDQMDSPKGRMQLAGKLKGCIDCHGGADGKDFSFINDGL